MSDKKIEELSLEQKIVNFFVDNPYPEDEKVHAFSSELGMNEEMLEKKIYELVSTILCGGKSREKENIDKVFDEEQLKVGLGIEYEHVDKNSPFADILSLKIAKDHLSEFRNYYIPGLVEMERKLEEFKNEYKVEEKNNMIKRENVEVIKEVEEEEVGPDIQPSMSDVYHGENLKLECFDKELIMSKCKEVKDNIKSALKEDRIEDLKYWLNYESYLLGIVDRLQTVESDKLAMKNDKNATIQDVVSGVQNEVSSIEDKAVKDAAEFVKNNTMKIETKLVKESVNVMEIALPATESKIFQNWLIDRDIQFVRGESITYNRYVLFELEYDEREEKEEILDFLKGNRLRWKFESKKQIKEQFYKNEIVLNEAGQKCKVLEFSENFQDVERYDSDFTGEYYWKKYGIDSSYYYVAVQNIIDGDTYVYRTRKGSSIVVESKQYKKEDNDEPLREDYWENDRYKIYIDFMPGKSGDYKYEVNLQDKKLGRSGVVASLKSRKFAYEHAEKLKKEILSKKESKQYKKENDFPYEPTLGEKIKILNVNTGKEIIGKVERIDSNGFVVNGKFYNPYNIHNNYIFSIVESKNNRFEKVILEKGNAADYKNRINDEKEKIQAIKEKIQAKKEEMSRATNPDTKKKAQEIIKNYEDDIAAHENRIKGYEDATKAISKYDKVESRFVKYQKEDRNGWYIVTFLSKDGNKQQVKIYADSNHEAENKFDNDYVYDKIISIKFEPIEESKNSRFVKLESRVNIKNFKPGDSFYDVNGEEAEVERVYGDGYMDVLYYGNIYRIYPEDHDLDFDNMGMDRLQNESMFVKYQKEELTVWGILYLKDGTIIDLNGENLKDIKVNSKEIVDYGIKDIGDEANIYIPEINKVVKGLNNVRKLFEDRFVKLN
jgi:hypothetical protein